MAIKLNKDEEIIYTALKKAGASNIAQSFQKTGLPTRRNEHYHYSDLKMLLADIPQVCDNVKSASIKAFKIDNAYELSIINGGVQTLSTTPPAGVTISTSKGGIGEPNHDVLAQLNSALSKETLNLDLQGEIVEIVYIDRRSEGKATHVNDGLELNILDNSSATIIEVFSGSNEAHFSNHASNISLGKNAKATHIMVDLSGNKARHFQTIQYAIEQGANLRSLIIHDGSDLSRTQLFATFNGEDAHADLSGLSLVDDGQHSDITIDVRHNVPNTTSTEMYKSVARGRSKAIFQGKIVVARDAQKTDAKMMSQGLMLSDNAEILVKPELEIYADDVICGHGATCGALDENNLFYLMSRGIAKEQAKSMLVRAFLTELFDEIKGEKLQNSLLNIVDEWLDR